MEYGVLFLALRLDDVAVRESQFVLRRQLSDTFHITNRQEHPILRRNVFFYHFVSFPIQRCIFFHLSRERDTMSRSLELNH